MDPTNLSPNLFQGNEFLIDLLAAGPEKKEG